MAFQIRIHEERQATFSTDGKGRPATITSMDKADRGVIEIRYKGEPKSVSPGALRPWMEPIAFHAEWAFPVTHGLKTSLWSFLRSMGRGTSMLLGYVNYHGKWVKTSKTMDHEEMWIRAQRFAEPFVNCSPRAVRMGYGCHTIRATEHYTSAMLIWWSESEPTPNIMEHDPSKTLNL